MSKPDDVVLARVRDAIAAVEQAARDNDLGKMLREVGRSARLELLSETARDLFTHRIGKDVDPKVEPETWGRAVELWGHADRRQWQELARIAGALGWNVEPDALLRWWQEPR